MKKQLLFFISLAFSAVWFIHQANAQVVTNGGSGLSVSYPSLASAITALNAATITSPVVISLVGNETAPSGGYAITQQGGTATNTIILQAELTALSSTITAFSPQPTGNRLDAIFKIIGGDYITIRNFTMKENPGNTVSTVGINNMTEFGIAIFYASTSNGAQNDIIQGNTISLKSSYQNSIGIYSTTQHSFTDFSTVVPAISNNGLNSGMKIYGNSISNVAFGIQYVSTPNTPTITDSGVEIGGSSGSTGNIITFGCNAYSDAGWASFNNYPSGIKYMNGVNINIQYNSVTSTTIPTSVSAIRIEYSTTPYGLYYTNTINNNTIAVFSNGTGSIFSSCIMFGYVSPEGSMVCNNNTMSITQSVNTSTAGRVQGIINCLNGIYSEAIGNVITLTQNTSAGSNSAWVCAINNGQSTNPGPNAVQKIQDNIITIKQNSTGGTYAGDVVYIGSQWAGYDGFKTGTISNNQLLTTGSTIRTSTSLYGIHHDNTFSDMLTIDGNTINWNLTGPCNTYVTFATTNGYSKNINVTNNNINFTGPISGGNTHTMFYEQDGLDPSLTFKNISNNTVLVNTPNIYVRVTIFSTAKASGSFSNNNIDVKCASYITGSYFYYPTGPWTFDHNTYSFTSTGVSAMSNAILISYGSGHVVSNNTISTINFSAAGSSGPLITAININSTDNSAVNNIFGNKINGMSTGPGTGYAEVKGIWVSGGINHIYNNKITNLSSSCSGTNTIIHGISVTGGYDNVISNNLIGLTNSYTGINNALALAGIFISSQASGSSTKVYYNTVYLNLSSTGTNFGTTGIYQSAYGYAPLDLRNNIIVNTSVARGMGLTSAYYRSDASSMNYAATSDNNLFYAGTPGPKNLIMYDGTHSDQNLADYQARVAPADAASVSENPNWISTVANDAGFLHINPTIMSLIESGAANINGYPDDYDGDIRQGNPGYPAQTNGGGLAPDIGADEFDGTAFPSCTGVPDASTISGPERICAGTGTLLSLSNSYGRFITYQWASGTTPGGPYPVLLGNKPAQETGNLSVPTYYVCTITCLVSGLSFTTAEKPVLIDALPDIIVTPASALYCAPGGQPVTLSASGDAGNYAWSPAEGLDETTGSVVHASPAVATTYTVTVTDENGCKASAQSSVTVATSVSMNSVAATPPTVCFGGSTTLKADVSSDGGSTSYCDAYAEVEAYMKISNVSLNTINNNSNAMTGYEDFTGISTNLSAGTGYPVSVSVSNTYYPDVVYIWIDMNNDGIFDDPGEKVFSANVVDFCPSCSGNTTIALPGTIHIPANATNGMTRMRVRLFYSYYGANTTPCSSSTYGQVEDYSVNITNGVDPFTYSWAESPGSGTLTNTGINPTEASGITVEQTYSVIATAASGCTTSGSVVVPIKPTPILVISNITACAAPRGVSLTIPSVTAGSFLPPATVLTYWYDPACTASPIANPKSVGAGTYYVRADCSGCYVTAPVTVTLNRLPTIFLGTGSGSYCAGGQGLELGLSGSEPGVQYTLWMGFTNLTTVPVIGNGGPISFGFQSMPGQYWVLAEYSVSHCTNRMYNAIYITITEPLKAVVNISASNNPVPAGKSVTLTAIPFNGGSAPFYQWQVNGSNAGSGGPTFTYTPKDNDKVGCVLTSSEPCVKGPATSNIVTLFIENRKTSGVKGKIEFPVESPKTVFRLYPNPAQDEFIIRLDQDVISDSVLINVYDVSGNIVMKGIMNGERRHEFDIRWLSRGLYFVRISVGKTVQTVKLVKQ